MRDTQVTRPRRTEQNEHHKIRISGVGVTNHPNPPEILAQNGSQQAARASLPESPVYPPLNATDAGEVLTMPTKALYTVSEATSILSLSRTMIYELLRSGRLRSVREGAARRIPAQAIADYVALLESETIGRAA
jgi:excisionase family DNA binding protein